MDAEDKFIAIAALICEPARARMLWNLLDGRAYTASELSAAADISATALSNHLSKLLKSDVLKFEMQGRHRYYSFANAEVAYVVEAMANLANDKTTAVKNSVKAISGVKYCRSCYDHLAGYVGVSITEAMEQKRFLDKSENIYLVTKNGWEWFEQFDIYPYQFDQVRRPLTRQCLDWSERRPHLAGQLGAVFFKSLQQRKWFKKIQFSRELIVTATAREEMYHLLNLTLAKT